MRPAPLPAARAIASLALCGGALACAPAKGETIVSFFLGQSATRSSDVRIDQQSTGSSATFSGVQWEDRSWELPPYYALRVAHYFERAPAWGLAADFVHYKIYASTEQTVPVNGTWNGAPVSTNAPIGQRVQSLASSHGVNYLGLSVLRRWRIDASERCPHGRWQPYLGAGPVYYVLHPEITVNGQIGGETYQGAGIGFQLLAGTRYALTERWSLFLEARYDQGRVKVDIAGGQAETDLATRQASFGLGYTF